MSAAKPKKTTESSKDLLVIAFEVIAETGWSDFSFNDLADRAGLSFSEIRGFFKSKSAILDALNLRLDEAMLAVDRGELSDLPMRDRVFELMMSRLEAMAPLRAGVLRLSKDARQDSELVIMTACRLDRSMGWLQDAAGLRSGGVHSRLQQHILTALYLKTLNSWFADDGADLAKTMASLDKDLRRIESFAGLANRQSRKSQS
ncbi:MAG: TetR family transcriptional regulator [Geminicoccaceae bacterium]